MAIIDIKNIKLLNELDSDARQTNSSLSKKVRLSKKGIEYRISQLSKKGIIQGYYPVVDFLKLGYSYNRVFIKLQYLDDGIKQLIEEYIRKTDSVNWAVWFKGDYDLGLAFWTKTATSFKERLLDFVVIFNNNIQKLHPSQVLQLEQYSINLPNKDHHLIATMKETSDSDDIDKLDKDILLELNENARLPSTQIAKNIYSHYKIVSYRIKRLIKNKILLTTRTKTDNSLLGLIHYKIFAYVSYTNKKDIIKIKTFISSLQQCYYIVDHTEVTFIDFEVLVTSVSEFHTLLDNLNNTFPGMIKEFRYFTFGKTIKINFLPKE